MVDTDAEQVHVMLTMLFHVLDMHSQIFMSVLIGPFEKNKDGFKNNSSLQRYCATSV